MSLNSEKTEIEGIVNRLLDVLSAAPPTKVGSEAIVLRHKIGDLRASFFDDLRDGTFTSDLLACFTAAREANVKLTGLFSVHQSLFAENPVGLISVGIVQAAIVFCLATESRMILLLEFVSRDDVEVMMNKMKTAFDTARNLAADMLDSSAYQNLTTLAGALTNHLANVSRPLPRMLSFSLSAAFPALTLSQRIYYSAFRWEEIIQENKIVHPAFCPREIRGLSV